MLWTGEAWRSKRDGTVAEDMHAYGVREPDGGGTPAGDVIYAACGHLSYKAWLQHAHTGIWRRVAREMGVPEYAS